MKQGEFFGPRPDPKASSKGRNVKRAAAGVVDAHERTKRDFLTQAEVDRLVAGARGGRFGARDSLMVLLAYRHGLRASELIKLRIDDFDLDTGRLWVKRLKNGLSTRQPLAGDELRAVKAYLRSRDDRLPYAFLSSQGGPMTRQAWYYLVGQAGERAELGPVHPHMLRHTTGHLLADRDTRVLQDWLGHRDIRHTAHYSRTSSKRFEGLWGR